MTASKVVFLIGAAGSGKSTVGKFLAAKLNFCYLDKDMISNIFTGALLSSHGYPPTARDQCDYYKNEVMNMEYDTLLNVAGDNLKIGNSVILDAPFLGYFADPMYIQNFIEKFQLHNTEVYVLNVYVDHTILKQRIIERNNDRDSWKLENWDVFTASIKERKCVWQGASFIDFANNSSTIDENKLLMSFVNND